MPKSPNDGWRLAGKLLLAIIDRVRAEGLHPHAVTITVQDPEAGAIGRIDFTEYEARMNATNLEGVAAVKLASYRLGIEKLLEERESTGGEPND